MKYIFAIVIFLVCLPPLVNAHSPNYKTSNKNKSQQLRPRDGNCAPATKQYDMEINNVRARLLNGGDLWYDLNNNGRYIVPKIPLGSGLKEVSSLFAGAVWVGGYDPAGALKFMGQTFRGANSNDCWPGPLNPTNGETNEADCLNWDRFFTVSGQNITDHLKLFKQAVAEGRDRLDVAEIPEDILYWPARGNKYFEPRYKFPLPFLPQGLALFHDNNRNRSYEPELGDYPVIDVRGCKDDIYPDEMTFWIYNDAGGIHTASNGSAIRMEVQVQAFGYQRGDEINDMTFYRYKLINRAPQEIRDCYFAQWTDPDLGCYSDDYIGCNPDRELMYIFNIDASDGNNGCNCDRGVNTYCTDIPILGIDYFRGPLGPKVFERDLNGNIIRVNGIPRLKNPDPGTGQVDTTVEIGMSTFMYYNNGSSGSPHPNTTDPSSAVEHYNYITGKWKDGTPLTEGGTGYNPGSNVIKNYAFPGEPNDAATWSMCSPNTGGEGDRRTIQATGPLLLTPGAINELIIGVVWVPDQDYPCPNLSDLFKADDLSQDLFDNCFELKDGPDAPDVDFVELDREIIMILSNALGTNNYNEKYEEGGLGFPPGVDTLYRFEGYRIFQVSGPDVTLNDRNIADPTKVREIFNVDIKNKVKKVYNWLTVDNPFPSSTKPKVYYPVEMVNGLDNGIRHTFQIKEDQFATGDRALINHKKYYFLVIAYSYNNYKSFSADDYSGQAITYCPGRINIGSDGKGTPYVAIPRPAIYEDLKAGYGDGVQITRRDGIGVGHNFVRLTESMYDKLLDKTYGGVIDYQEGSGPIEVKIYNPLIVKDGEYEVRFRDPIPDNTKLDNPVTWTLINKNNPSEVINSTGDFLKFNEQVIAKYGISIGLGQTIDAGGEPRETNGIIGNGLEGIYKDINGPRWFIGLSDDNSPFRDFIKVALGQSDYALDPLDLFSNLGEDEFNGTFFPYKLTVGDSTPFSPAWINGSNNAIRGQMRLDSLNNVDIIFTSDKSKWSRCIVIETWNPNNGSQMEPVTGNRNFEVKKNPSVGKFDNDGDGYADNDGDGTGFGWFPGYAVDVETGKRVNIFFGENSFYSTDDLIVPCLKDQKAIGNDMMWNPTDQGQNNACFQTVGALAVILGGHHYIYVTKQAYDSCKAIKGFLSGNPTLSVRNRALRELTWASMPFLIPGTTLTPLGSSNTGLIPNDLRISLRVNNPYQYSVGTNENLGHNLYTFKIDSKQSSVVTDKSGYNSALENVNVVPNPYYGFSSYETGQFSNVVKITNLPAKCNVTIYSVDGKFIRQYKRDEVPLRINGPDRGLTEKQISPDLEWDLTNFKGIPVSSGAYLIHIQQPDTGAEIIVKWFGVARKFDPSGL
ncbi:MAG: hypothetical protein M3Q56_12075 [Bacteroidota bacterium]|nr:hypothetical protein [Bacteroidota bacterium]